MEEKDENLSRVARGEICLLEREQLVEETGAGTMNGQGKVGSYLGWECLPIYN